MNSKLPSDALKKPAKRLPLILSVTAAVAIAASAVAFGPALASQLNPAPVPSPTLTPYVSTLTPAELDSAQQGADQQATIIAADEAAAAAAAQAAADAAAKAAQHHSSAGGAPGSPVPFIASSDPNNANGGDYLDPAVYCQSHSASGNPPICD